MRILLLITLMFGCAKAKDKFPESEAPEFYMMDYRAHSQRLVEEHTYGGFGVVSRGPDGSAKHSGEALIWGGTAMWALPCDMAANLSLEMARMIDQRNGAIIRVLPLGEYENGREVSFDGFTGLILGISRRITDCGELDLWIEPVTKLIDYQKANDNRMHPNVPQKIFGEFVYVRDLIGSYLNIVTNPSDKRLLDLEKLVGAWAFAVRTAHVTGKGSDACFRVNLGLSTFLAAETLGRSVSQKGRDQFCDSTKDMNIPSVDHWCGRENIKSYIESYVEDQYEYRHQRCGYESPDGKDNKSPRLDKIIAYVLAYGWKNLQY
jgi:hypothetical protein